MCELFIYSDFFECEIYTSDLLSQGRQEELPESMLLYSYHPSEPLSKERVEAFTDGVYAIVATLLILDIW